MNNLRFSSGHPALTIKEELAPNNREEMKNITDNFQQGLRLCSPRLQASMDDYSINYHGSLAVQHSARYGMSSGVACGLVAPRRSSSLPPILRELTGNKGAVTLNSASPTKDLNHGTPLFTLFNLSTPRTNFSTDGADGSWTSGLQLVSNRDCAVEIEMHGTPMEHFHSGGEISPNTEFHSSVPTISDDFDRVPSGPLAYGAMNERAQLLDKLTIVAPPHLDNSVTSIEEQRRAAKLARALEEPFEFNSQNRIMEEYELQLTPMDNGDGFDFMSLSPVFPPTPMGNSNWESSLVFQFEDQVRLEIKSESSPTQPQVPELKFNGDGSAMTKMPRDHFRIPEQFNMEAEMLANIAPDRNLLINLSSPNQPDVNGASFANGTGNEQNAALVDDSSAATHSTSYMDSIEEKLCTANLVKHLEEPYEYNLQNRIMAEYEEQLAPMNISYGFNSNYSSPTFLLHPIEDGNREEQLVFQFPIQSQLEDSEDSNPTKGSAQQLKEPSKKSKRAVTPNLGEFHIRDSKPMDAKADEQAPTHARRLAARMVRQEERENEFNGQNRVMYEYEQMEPIDITDDNNYSCPSPIYQGSQTVELEILSDSEVPESMNSFSSLTSWSSLTEECPNGNGDHRLPDESRSAVSSPSYGFDALTSLEDQLHFMNLAKSDETGQDFFNKQRFVMAEYEKNEPMDVTNELSYKWSSPMFSTSSSFFTAQDSMDTKSTDHNRCNSCCEMVNDSRQSICPILPSIDYSAQSLNQCGRNRDEQLDNGRDHVDNGLSDGWSRCTKDSRACRNSPGMDQSYYEKAADPTGREVSPTGKQGEFQEPTLSGLLGSQHFSAVLAASCSFDDEYEDDDDEEEVFIEFSNQNLVSNVMEGQECDQLAHSQFSGSANDTDSSSDVDIFVSAPSAIERRAMSEFPGCSMEHARGMLDRRLHDKIARQLDSVDTCNQEETVIMEFEAGLGSGVCDDEDDGFNGEVEIDVDNHEEDWNDETGGVCEADIPIFPQSSFVYPPDSGGR